MTELLVGHEEGPVQARGRGAGRVRGHGQGVRRSERRVRDARSAHRALPRLRHLVVLRPEALGHRRSRGRVGAGGGRRAAGGRRRDARAALGHRPGGGGRRALRGRGSRRRCSRARDGGLSWELNRGLWEHPSRGRVGARERRPLPPHDRPWPGDPKRLLVAISAVGVWLTEDGGETWRVANDGIVAALHPRGGAGDGDDEPLRPRRAPRALTARAALHAVPRRRLPLRRRRRVLDRHRHRHGAAVGLRLPDRRRPGRPGQRLRHPAGRRRGPRRRRTARCGSGRRATRARRGRRAATGCPHSNAYLTVLREAFDAAGEGQGLELYFGATSGDVFGSADGGATWGTVAEHLAPVYSVRPRRRALSGRRTPAAAPRRPSGRARRGPRTRDPSRRRGRASSR